MCDFVDFVWVYYIVNVNNITITVDCVGVRLGGVQKHLGVGHSQIAVSVKDTSRAQWAVDDLQNGSVLLLSKQMSERDGRRAGAHHCVVNDVGAACAAVLSYLKVWPAVGWLKSWYSSDSRSCGCQAELMEGLIPGQHPWLCGCWIRPQMVALQLGFHQAQLSLPSPRAAQGNWGNLWCC